MAMTGEFLEEGEIESDADEPQSSASRRCTAPENVPGSGGGGYGDGARSEGRERSSQPGKRRRRHGSRERSNSKEPKASSLQLDPVEIAEMDEYEMLCIRGASPPHGPASVGESFQRIYANQGSATYYEYERAHRYESDDENYSKRRLSPPSKRRRDRGRRRQRQNRRNSPERRSMRRRSNSGDDQEDKEERKMEICKFYLLDCCVKRTICRYMHAEFPCKFYYLGLECQNEKPCKFLHGKALTEEMTNALARHIAAAPKAILGNFKRYSRDRALQMIEAKNRQLNAEDGKIAGKESSSMDNKAKEAKSLSSSPLQASSSQSSLVSKHTKHPKDISAIFSVKQIEKITALGITDLHQVKQMSLAQLTDIGLSLSQIGEIQKTGHHNQKYFCKVLESEPVDQLDDVLSNYNEGKEELNATKGDMDMRQLLPSLPATMSSGQDVPEEPKSTNSSRNSIQNIDVLHYNHDVEQEPSEADSSSLQLFDDEPELVIDETIDERSDKIDDENQNEKNSHISSFGDISNWTPHYAETLNFATAGENSKTDLNEENNDKDSSISSEGALFDNISFDEPFEPSEDLNCEQEETESKNRENQNNLVLSDYDMRLPFADAIANYVPALEIDASMKSHLGVQYKLIEIVIPSKNDPQINFDNIPENTLDPRLKKLLSNKSKKTEESSISFRLDVNNTLSLVNPYKTESQGNEISADPRKRKEQSSDANSKPIQQNFNYVLNTFLQKSKWYQNLNSKLKIDINQLLADLSGELNKFSQNTSRDRRFQMSSMAHSNKIEEILCEIGLEVNSDGILQERKAPKVPDPVEVNYPQRKEGFCNDIPSLLNINMNQNAVQVAAPSFTQKGPLMPSIQVVMPSLPHPRFEFPKPGLLGIAPGIEGPPSFIRGPNRMPNFNTALNPQIWSEHPANYGMSNMQNLPKICGGMEEMNRNPFSMPMGKRWNRNPNLKRPRRI